MIPAELCENPHFSPTQAYSKTMKMLEANIQTSSCCLASLMRFFWSRLFFHTSCIISHLLLNFGAQKTAWYWKGPRHTLLIFWHESALSCPFQVQLKYSVFQHLVQHHLFGFEAKNSGSHLFRRSLGLGWKFTFGFFYNQFVGTTRLLRTWGTLTSK